MKKKSIMMTSIAIIVLVIALIISLVFVFNHNDTKAYNSKLEQAQKYVSKLDYKKAEDAYLQAIDIDPKQATAYNELADLYMNNGEEEKAANILKKGYKVVNDSSDKTKIKEKQDKVENKVINNGGNYVTYKGKSYYWEYTPESFDEGFGYKGDVDNKLICIDKSGNKETLYEGKGYGNLWIYKNKIYCSYSIDEFSIDGLYSCFSINLNGSNPKTIGNIEFLGVCSNGLIVNNFDNHEFGILADNKFEKIESFTPYDEYEDTSNGVEISLMTIDNENIYYSVCSGRNRIENYTLKSLNVNTNETRILNIIGAQECIGRSLDSNEWITQYMDTAQLIGDNLYFNFQWFLGNNGDSLYKKSGYKIAKVKTDGTGFKIIKEAPGYSYSGFTIYQNKNGKEIIKFNGRLNETFVIEDKETKSEIVYIYTEESTNKKKILSPNEYLSFGTYLKYYRYNSNNLYFTVADKNEDDDVLSYTYCIKNLNTNKITVYQQIKF